MHLVDSSVAAHNGAPSRNWMNLMRIERGSDSVKASDEPNLDRSVEKIMPSGGRLGAPNPAKSTKLRNMRKLPKSIRDKKDLVLDTLREGGTYKLAAAGVGIGDRALRYWRADDPQFEVQCRMAQAEHCMEQLGNVRKAGRKDWKASMALLRSHPMTRGDFREDKGEARIQVTVNFDRKGIIIDGKPQSITMDDD